jgi:hypothetical protein
MYMLILNFTYPLKCLCVPLVEYHWFRQLKQKEVALFVANVMHLVGAMTLLRALKL